MAAIGVIGVTLLFVFLLLRALKRVGDPREPSTPPAPPPAPTKAPPGFYMHPSGVTRWWDGSMWTEQTKPDA
ncbi:DUF2510 domain-containing protein [Nocardia higoensis]|uniref:DUF2510 domain-containing protein n=2 Tax=Nocardia higoensis TaxID=228599 RepID=A0ABS0DIB6_9NOCA|nr:DUF2510 domain-containing protein [Nocardia higoensis]